MDESFGYHKKAEKLPNESIGPSTGLVDGPRFEPVPSSVTEAMAAYASSSVAEIPPDSFLRSKLYPAPPPTVKFILLR
jgi:hypothetical protein